MNEKYNTYFKMFFGFLLTAYAVAVFYVSKNTCAIYSIENCSLNGTLGLSYITIWSVMIIGGLYFIYLAIASLKHGVYSSEKILLMHKTEPVTGKKLYVYCFIFVVGAVASFLFAFIWWNSLVDTLAEYNYLYPDRNVTLIK